VTAVLVSVSLRGAHVDIPDALELTAPLPGLPDHVRYSLTPLDEIGVLFALRSDGEPQVRLFVVPPREFFPDYEPVIPSAVRTALDLTDAETVLLTVVSPPQGDEPATANLLAPIVVNARTGLAVQTVLDDSGWPLRAPLG
jgi:flagellar assembly factor FliW